jgi:hypothetical protein
MLLSYTVKKSELFLSFDSLMILCHSTGYGFAAESCHFSGAKCQSGFPLLMLQLGMLVVCIFTAAHRLGRNGTSKSQVSDNPDGTAL